MMMKRKSASRSAAFVALALFVMATALYAAQASVWVKGYFAVDKAARGKIIQAVLVMDIPEGYHVNSNKPLGKYAIPTAIEIKAPDGIKIGPVVYPRSTVRRFKFSEEQLAVYEGRAVVRFNVSVPADYALGQTEVMARLRYQSCTDEVCFPPATREVKMPIEVVAAGTQVANVNTSFFGVKGK